MSETYVCRKCGVEKGRDGFFKDVRDRRGIRTYECKECAGKAKRAKTRDAPAYEPLSDEVTELFNKWLLSKHRRAQ